MRDGDKETMDGTVAINRTASINAHSPVARRPGRSLVRVRIGRTANHCCPITAREEPDDRVSSPRAALIRRSPRGMMQCTGSHAPSDDQGTSNDDDDQ